LKENAGLTIFDVANVLAGNNHATVRMECDTAYAAPTRDNGTHLAVW
jgi:hypothetical protein